MIFTDEELKPFGYAEGGYVLKCHDCGEESWHVDKRASVCRDCAEKRAVKFLRAEMDRLADENSNLRAVSMGVVAHMGGRQPVRGWLRDNNASRDALNALAEAVLS